jgi:hypothetical protein
VFVCVCVCVCVCMCVCVCVCVCVKEAPPSLVALVYRAFKLVCRVDQNRTYMPYIHRMFV